MRGPRVAALTTTAFLLGAATGVGWARWTAGSGASPDAAVAETPGPPAVEPPSERWPEGFVGVVLASASTDLTPAVEGRLAEVRVGLGDEIHAGDVVAVITVPGASGRIAEARAALDAARAQRSAIEVDWRAAEQQLDQLPTLTQAISRQEAADLRFSAERARAALERAEAEVQTRAHQLENLEATLSEAVVLAPFSGRIAARYLDPGAQVGPGTALVRLQAPTDRVRFAIPVEALAEVSPGRQLAVELTTPERTLLARVDQVSPTLEPASGLLFAEATLDGTAEPLISGAPVRVRLP